MKSITQVGTVYGLECGLDLPIGVVGDVSTVGITVGEDTGVKQDATSR